MKKRRVMGKAKRSCLLFLHRLFVTAAVLIFAALACNSKVTVESNGKVYQQHVAWDNRSSFEESSLFNDMLREELGGITRMVVIKSQLETDGNYNGVREVDIAQYAHRDDEFLEMTVSAPYFLDDLVKWGNYGFVTESVYATEAELDFFLSTGINPLLEGRSDMSAGIWNEQTDATKEMLRDMVGGKEQDTLSMRMIEQLPSSREDYMRLMEEWGKIVEEDSVVELRVLIPRYLSAEGKDLAEYAQNVEEYISLREDLRTTSRDLFYNFTEYTESKNRYAKEATNLRYCYRMTVNGELCYFTNVEDNFKEKKIDEITRQFEGYGKYIYYNADRSEIATNTQIQSDLMKTIMGTYQYAFGDNTRVWLAVDETYPVADHFYAARESYNRLSPYYRYLAVAVLFFFACSLIVWIELTRYEGRVMQEEGGYRIELRRSDQIPTELFALWAAACIAPGVIGYLALSYCANLWRDTPYGLWMPCAAGVLALYLDCVFLFFYLGFVRRAKAHTLWKKSAVRWILQKLRLGILSLYDNGPLLVRTLLPFVAILALNLILGGCGLGGICVSAVLDILAILILYREKTALRLVVETAKRIGNGELEAKVDAETMHGENRELACAVNGIGDGIKTAVETSMKDERLKADLITNVSHDIKTPLTSIINFVDLLKREKIENERVRGYIEVLDSKSQRLKQLTDDLVEASKISSGNISLQMERINFAELVNQTCGEFADKFRERGLTIVRTIPENPVYIEADSRRIWRVVENLFSNACKYALEGTRVYLEIRETQENGKKAAVFSMKNISAQALNIDAKELTERFIRGDVSRSTEGSGLGLSIARNLTELQKGKFEIYLDGDLFKVLLTFPGMEAAEE